MIFKDILIYIFKMLAIIKDTLSISSNERTITSNRILTNTLLDKASYIEADIINNKEDYNENIKILKHITEFNNNEINKLNEVLEEKIENLEEDNLELKSMLLKTTKHILKKDEEQRKINKKKDEEIYNLNRLVFQLSEKLNIVLENNTQPVINNNKEILEQVEKVDKIAMKMFRLIPKKEIH